MTDGVALVEEADGDAVVEEADGDAEVEVVDGVDAAGDGRDILWML